MKALTLLLSLLLPLTSCGDSSIASPPSVVKEVVSRDGAYNSDTAYASSTSELQSLIDNLPEGGRVVLPCGIYTGSVIVLHSNITLMGSGRCTEIPSLTTEVGRSYFISISDLSINGDLDGYNNIGIDLRDCSICRVDDVFIRNVDYGVFLYGQAYYNEIEGLTINPNKTCYEIGGVANENIIRGGRCIRGELGVWITDANNIRIMNSSFESMSNPFLLGTGALHTMIFQPRCEAVEVCIDVTPGSSDTTIISPYVSNTGIRIRGLNYREL